MGSLHLSDIQGILLHGYKRMKGASFLIIEIRDPALCREWISTVTDNHRITTAEAVARERCFNLAFTHAGLEILAEGGSFHGFSREFVEGMTAPHRQRILGDHANGRNDPRTWSWGGTGPSADPVHLLIMLYAADPRTVLEESAKTANEVARFGMHVIASCDGNPLKDGKEHFGFRDGLSNPSLDVSGDGGPSPNAVKAGEFILGQRNEAGDLPPSPRWMTEQGELDWGRNGSYLVFRQLSQDVAGFWEAMQESAAQLTRCPTPADTKMVASKMVGRWPNGMPLTLSPHSDRHECNDLNAFSFAESDPEGLGCPVGAHIRRTNPRDSGLSGPEDSVAFVKRHRILRRGRTYGPPLTSDACPPEALTESEFPECETKGERGILFLCFNTNLRGQFEFVQQTWINNPKHMGTYDSVDPIAGAHGRRADAQVTTFIIPGSPLRKRVTGLPSFISVRGGAYFFLPGIAAIETLARIR